MPLHQLKKISNDLELNINTLEEELSDASKFIYQLGENTNSEGIKILQDISTDLRILCEELEEAVRQDETTVQQITEELDATKVYVRENEEKQIELQNFLIQQNLLQIESETHDQHEDVQSDVRGSESYLQEKKCFQTAPSSVPSPPADGSFLIARVEEQSVQETLESNQENQSYLQNTIYDFKPVTEPGRNKKNLYYKK